MGDALGSALRPVDQPGGGPGAAGWGRGGGGGGYVMYGGGYGTAGGVRAFRLLIEYTTPATIAPTTASTRTPMPAAAGPNERGSPTSISTWYCTVPWSSDVTTIENSGPPPVGTRYVLEKLSTHVSCE